MENQAWTVAGRKPAAEQDLVIKGAGRVEGRPRRKPADPGIAEEMQALLPAREGEGEERGPG